MYTKLEYEGQKFYEDLRNFAYKKFCEYRPMLGKTLCIIKVSICARERERESIFWPSVWCYFSLLNKLSSECVLLMSTSALLCPNIVRSIFKNKIKGRCHYD